MICACLQISAQLFAVFGTLTAVSKAARRVIPVVTKGGHTRTYDARLSHPGAGPGSPRKKPRALALFLLYAYRLSGGFLKADRLQNCEETATLSQNASNTVLHARTAIPLQQGKSTRVHVARSSCPHLMAYQHPRRPGAPAVRDNNGGDSRARVGLEVPRRQRCP